MNAQEIEVYANALIQAHQAREKYIKLDGSLDDAYRVQRRYQALARSELGHAQPVGYKIALTSVAMQTLVGVSQPLAGCVFADLVHANGAEIRLADHCHLGVEFEIAVRLGADLPRGPAPHTRASVAQAVDGYAPAYELIEDRFADYSEINAFSVVAENCWNAGVVIGTYCSGPVADEAGTRLSIDAAPSGAGRASDALGHPLEAVAWLANRLNDAGLGLRKGEFVMTGSSIRTTFPDAGQHYNFIVDGLGAVEVRFV